MIQWPKPTVQNHNHNETHHVVLQHGLAQMASFFYPDYTVGTGISPVPALRLVDFANILRHHRSGIGTRPHPAPKENFQFVTHDMPRTAFGQGPTRTIVSV